jgi:hypothetical protein
LGTVKLPFTLTVTDNTVTTAGNGTVNSPSAGSLACNGANYTTPCASTHAFESIDKEYWDVSVGVTAPGVRETKFTFATNAVTKSTKTNTNLYGMLDIYWTARWHPKDYPILHPFVGLPVSGQTFYRPAFGMAQPINGLKILHHKISLPISVNAFAGMVYMRTSYLVGTPTTQAAFNTDLKPTRVWKPVFGIEVPISSMASKLGKKSSTAGKGGTGSGTPGAN